MRPRARERDVVVSCGSVREFMDELVHWTADYVGETVEPVEDAGRVGYRLTWENAYRPPSVTLWVPRAGLKDGGAWGRALATEEGRKFVASREEGFLYWCGDSPRYEGFGQVWFDP